MTDKPKNSTPKTEDAKKSDKSGEIDCHLKKYSVCRKQVIPDEYKEMCDSFQKACRMPKPVEKINCNLKKYNVCKKDTIADENKELCDSFWKSCKDHEETSSNMFKLGMIVFGGFVAILILAIIYIKFTRKNEDDDSMQSKSPH